MNLGFRFKHFFVRHDRCAMKVGTDGVLLGAWTPCEQSEIRNGKYKISNQKSQISNLKSKILDIGTGSGLIALMLAQRCPNAQIDAIDIDPDAVSQARDNFAASPWSDRLHVTQCALQEWQEKDYDLIVSNPPYFVNSLKNPDDKRCLARHTDSLPFSDLIAESAKRLVPNGVLSVIAPMEAEHLLIGLASENRLTCIKKCEVHSKPGYPAKRVMIAWQRNNDSNHIPEIPTEHLTLEDDHGSRSLDYQLLTRDFYL